MREGGSEWREGVSKQGRRVREIVKEGGSRVKEPKAMKKEGSEERRKERKRKPLNEVMVEYGLVTSTSVGACYSWCIVDTAVW